MKTVYLFQHCLSLVESYCLILRNSNATRVTKGVLIGTMLCFHSLLASAGSQELSLRFTAGDRIDSSGFAARNPTRPFHFNLVKMYGTEQAETFPFTVDIGTKFKVWLDQQTPNVVGKEYRSLAVQITSDKDENVKDKIFLDAVPHSSSRHIDIVNDTAPHELSFDFMLDPNYEAPHNWLIHMQAWQCCGGHPPFTISVTPSLQKNGPIEFVFSTSNDEIEAVENGKSRRELFRTEIARGVWRHVRLLLEPRANTDPRMGLIAMWLDGEKKFFVAEHWGYLPAAHDSSDGHITTSHLGIDLGIYRRRESTTQTIYFNNISYTSIDGQTR